MYGQQINSIIDKEIHSQLRKKIQIKIKFISQLTRKTEKNRNEFYCSVYKQSTFRSTEKLREYKAPKEFILDFFLIVKFNFIIVIV